MTLEISLLDLLALRTGCVCLSDLRFLDSGALAGLLGLLARIPPSQASLAEWNDCLTYLTGSPPCGSRAEAKRQLMERLGGVRQSS